MKSRPVYFVSYDYVVRMSHKRALQFVSACISGIGSTEMCEYGTPVRRKTNFVDSEGYESDNPQIMNWCAWRGYFCFHITDFEISDYRCALFCLEAGDGVQFSAGEGEAV